MLVYFLPWVVFLAICILAIPVAAVREKGKRKKLAAASSSATDDQQGLEEEGEVSEVESFGDSAFAEQEFGSAQ